MVWSRLLLSAWVAAAIAAHAESPAPTAAPVPGSTSYASAFTDYRRYADVEIVSWKGANEEAAKLGGPMGQMKPGAMPAAPGAPETPTNPAAASKPAAPSHSGHPR